MTRLRMPLLFWLMRQGLPATVPAAVTAWLYVLLNRELLDIPDVWAWVFIGLHCLALTACWGRLRNRGGSYLYTRGFDRNTLWNHLVLATIASAAIVWAPAAAMIWTGLRCLVQDRTFQSPNFPIMARLENATPVAWLAGYALLLATFHYTWIRNAQPTRGHAGGGWMAAGMVVVVFTCLHSYSFRHGIPWWAWAAIAVIIILLLVLSRHLHRRMEVHS